MSPSAAAYDQDSPSPHNAHRLLFLWVLPLRIDRARPKLTASLSSRPATHTSGEAVNVYNPSCHLGRAGSEAFKIDDMHEYFKEEPNANPRPGSLVSYASFPGERSVRSKLTGMMADSASNINTGTRGSFRGSTSAAERVFQEFNSFVEESTGLVTTYSCRLLRIVRATAQGPPVNAPASPADFEIHNVRAFQPSWSFWNPEPTERRYIGHIVAILPCC